MINRLVVMLLCLMAVSVANAGTIEQNLKKNMPNTEVQKIKKSQLKGIYEVQVGKNIFYTNKEARYLMFGHLYDIKTGVDLTANTMEEISRVKWSDLPLKNAIVSGPKAGKKIAIFTDPDCPYCKSLEKVLLKNKDFRVYTFLFPLTQIHPGAYAKTEAIWCSEDKHKALVDLLVHNKSIQPKECNTPISSNIALAERFGVQGTPTIISEAGTRKSGARNYEELKAWVNAQ